MVRRALRERVAKRMSGRLYRRKSFLIMILRRLLPALTHSAQELFTSFGFGRKFLRAQKGLGWASDELSSGAVGPPGSKLVPDIPPAFAHGHYRRVSFGWASHAKAVTTVAAEQRRDRFTKSDYIARLKSFSRRNPARARD
jgi:hypothetical protein